ncbi:MAG: aspartate aminotransferase [Desulfurococcales archaeon ex4484_42]|nr:MAG: aspartate aminotransferase [Desulfurococcales archaeon ex4484_42]
MLKISDRIRSIKPSPHRALIAQADEDRRKGYDVINFTAGQPGLPPMLDAVKAFIDEFLKDPFKHSKYLPTPGLYDLKVEICKDLKKYGGVNVVPEEVLITAGGVEAINLALSVVTDPGDEVFFLDPCYSVYWGLAKYLGLKVVSCPQTIDREFQPDPECIKEKITSRTVAILFASPDNPTSRIIDVEVIKTMADLAMDKKVWFIYDEAYKHIVYEGNHVWIHNYGNIRDFLISINSFSKDLAIPGFRIGYVYGPKEVIKEMTKLKGFTSITTPTPSQYLAYYYLSRGLKERYLNYALSVYRERKEVMAEALRKYLPEAKFIRPKASMYYFPDISNYLNKLGMDDVKFCYELGKIKHVYILPGSIFGPSGKGHVRITFVTQPPNRIEEGISRINEYLRERGAL